MLQPSCIADFKNLCKFDKFAEAYINGGSFECQTLKENCAAFKRLRLRPRVLCGTRYPDLSINLQGECIPVPICISPTGHHGYAHPDGECATARGAHKVQTCMCLSLMSSKSITQVRESSPDALLWRHFQLLADEKESLSLIHEAEKLNCKAIVLTVDCPMASIRKSFNEQKMAVDDNSPFFADMLEEEKSHVKCHINYMNNKLFHMTWDSVDWLRKQTKLPIILKGILTAEDALESLKHDVQGIIVSNHGGRQLDCVPATIEALPEVVEAINGKIDVYMDGGIRSGTDVFKALALGAKAVFIGRPILWGLGYKGAEGVEEVLNILSNELKIIMVLTGCSSISDIKKSMVVHESYYHQKLKSYTSSLDMENV